MNHLQLLSALQQRYPRFDPHHDTWKLWLKVDKSEQERFEVIIGTILVQNTNWKNVDKAIKQLFQANISNFNAILKCDPDQLLDLIRPAGFFNQKIIYLKNISSLFTKFTETVTRKELLHTKGVGKETADSILTFGLHQPFPIVGTYTRRFFAKFFGNSLYFTCSYEDIQQEIHSGITTTIKNDLSYTLGLYHTLIVVHSQNICTKRDPACNSCPLKEDCVYNNSIPFKIEMNSRINQRKKKSR